MQHQTIAITGGTGFIGRQLVSDLLAAGKAVRLAVRDNAHGQAVRALPVSVSVCDVHDPAQLQAFLQGADAVINLVGILHDQRQWPYGPGFRRAHVELPQKIVDACVALQIPRLLHMSALGADTQAPSMYLRSKGDGEQAVLAGAARGLQTTIFRPSVVFGPEDKFLNTFAALLKRLPFMPLASPDALFQPVSVDAVAAAFVRALDLDAAVGAIYELGGPRVYTLAELVRFAGAASGHSRPVIGLPEWAGRLQALMMEQLPNSPISRDNLDSMQIPSVVSTPPDPRLEFESASVESLAGQYLAGRPTGARASTP